MKTMPFNCCPAQLQHCVLYAAPQTHRERFPGMTLQMRHISQHACWLHGWRLTQFSPRYERHQGRTLAARRTHLPWCLRGSDTYGPLGSWTMQASPLLKTQTGTGSGNAVEQFKRAPKTTQICLHLETELTVSKTKRLALSTAGRPH